MTLAWGAKVSPEFRRKAREIAGNLSCDPSDLMSCIAWESARSFRPDVQNLAGSGAVGLIQFMPSTAAELGTTSDALAHMTAEAQLDFVARYFAPFKARLQDVADLYMAILWPSAVGKANSYVLFDKADAAHPARYRQNAGLDVNRDGQVTKREASMKVLAMKGEGFNPLNASE